MADKHHRSVTRTRVTLHHLSKKVDILMASIADLQADLDAIKVGVAALLAKVAAAPPVTQAQLDALDADAKAIVASLTPSA